MSAAAAPILEVDGLKTGYGSAEVLHGTSFTISAGEAVAIVGPNGAGKSTLLRALSGLIPTRGGEVRFHGRVAAKMSTHALVRSGLVHVPEGRQVFPGMSVKVNLELGAFSAPRGASRRLDEVIALFPKLGERLDQSAETLSGGEQQMLAIGRGLMADPKLLLLDEPTLGLAPIVIEELIELLKRARAELGTSMLVAEQNAALTRELCDRFHLLVSGRIVRAGEELPADLLAEYLGGAP